VHTVTDIPKRGESSPLTYPAGGNQATRLRR
jgi:hypothetical protein